MCDNGRLRQADKAYKDFVYLMEAHRGEVRAVVSAAEVHTSVMISIFPLSLCSIGLHSTRQRRWVSERDMS